MTMHQLTHMTWEEIDALDHQRCVALLPIGATEAHGPHLPLNTDVVISQAMVHNAAKRLAASDLIPIELPPLAYTAAAFAKDFPGTISIRPCTATALLVDIARSVAMMKIPVLALANSHLDPTHLRSLYDAIAICQDQASSPDGSSPGSSPPDGPSPNRHSPDVAFPTIAFPDITRKPWALRLTDEFKSGACHAGQYEGSIVMAARPDLVREKIQASLPDNPSSLSDAIRSGKQSFAEAGGEQAYFGYPSRASIEEGKETIDTLGNILKDSVLETFSDAADTARRTNS